MHDRGETPERLWGVRINTPRRRGGRDCPPWANSLQREKWEDRGLVIWDHRSHQIARLTATQALQLLDELQADGGWKQHGIVVGEPVTEISLDDPQQKARSVLINQINLSATQSQELFDVLQRNDTVLRQMSEEEERERQRRLGAVYRLLLNLARRQREQAGAAGVGSDDSE